MTIPSTPATLNYLRDNARTLLNEFDAADGLACYYALHHDPKRTTLFLHRGTDGQVDGFLTRCQTGIDLFRPMITLRVRGEGGLRDLLAEGLAPGRPYLMVVPPGLSERLKPHLDFNEPSLNLIYRLDPQRYRPELNVMVVSSTGPDGSPRVEVRQDGRASAVAGVNWMSPIFAEVFVHVEAEQRLMGLGRAVLKELCTLLIRRGVTPLYAVASTNDGSRKLAEGIGFVDTGGREVMAQVIYPG
ncbi:MAG: GNAT family N-acetyltransferase [Anaerolineae bacterium]|nr:GNAT family N-acetyltransferase [Anaerolineae bacterium]